MYIHVFKIEKRYTIVRSLNGLIFHKFGFIHSESASFLLG